MLSNGGRGLAIPPILLALLVIASGAAAGAQTDTSVPMERSPLPSDVQLGLEVAVSLVEGIGLVENEQWNDRLSGIGYQIAAAGEDEDAPYSFDILDLAEPNAMALPGGFVFVTRGIMEAELTDAELAHLLGHEIAHVRQRHFDRASRLNSVLSLARAALMVGVMLGVQESGPSVQRVTTSDDPGVRDWSVGMSGKEALLQASSIFGGVLHALFERGYSRKLEFEADEYGDRLATAAGFDPDGGPGLLRTLHERSYETHQFSYWRTHPYFSERVARSEKRAKHLSPADDPPSDLTYRQQQALFFASAAEKVHDEDQALFLFQCALRCEPTALGSLSSALELARFKRERERREHPLLRRYGPLIDSYDRIIADAEETQPDWAELPEVSAERKTLIEERDGLLPSQMEVIEGEAPPTDFLERFVENYPDHAQVPEMAHRLGMQYYLGGHPEKAVERLGQSLHDAAGTAWADSALAGMLKAIPEVEDMVACYSLFEKHEGREGLGHAEIAGAARARMDELVQGDFTLEQGGTFLSSWPESPWSTEVGRKVGEKADQAYLNGRVHEGLQRYQEALDSYYSVLTLAPDSDAAGRAEEAIGRIQMLAEQP
ncbi:MAG: M48 family metalloprotease [Candidatus Eisenbacteria bacterium]